jgi:hypothetical protein
MKNLTKIQLGLLSGFLMLLTVLVFKACKPSEVAPDVKIEELKSL